MNLKYGRERAERMGQRTKIGSIIMFQDVHCSKKVMRDEVGRPAEAKHVGPYTPSISQEGAGKLLKILKYECDVLTFEMGFVSRIDCNGARV